MSTNLIFDNTLLDFLYKTHRTNRISDILIYISSHIHSSIEYFSIDGNFFKIETDDIGDILSYLPNSKWNKLEYEKNEKDPFNGIGRIKIKVGRFLKKSFTEKAIHDFGIRDKDIENFVNLFKSYFSSNPKNIKIVEGVEILKWYSQDNYFTPDGNRYGTLWNSCMRHQERNIFMELYTKNPFIKMMVLFDDNGKIRARALLWEGIKDKEGKEYKIMDRIYTVFDHDVNFFKTWARENGYISKYEQNAKTESIFDIDNIPTNLEFQVKLDQSKFTYYPYLDSFKFFDEENGCLSNSPKFKHNHVLMSTHGGLDPDPHPEAPPILEIRMDRPTRRGRREGIQEAAPQQQIVDNWTTTTQDNSNYNYNWDLATGTININTLPHQGFIHNTITIRAGTGTITTSVDNDTDTTHTI